MTKKEEIIYLIQKGFSLEMISFELKVPIEQVRLYKKQLETVNDIESPLDKMRIKYQKLYSQNNKKIEEKNRHKQELTPQQLELIEHTIQEIEEKLGGIMLLDTKGQVITEIKRICFKLRQIKDYILPLEYSKKLYMIVQSQKKSKQARQGLARLGQEVVNKLAESFRDELARTDDIEKLKELSNQITMTMVIENPVPLSSIKNKINNKISSQMQKLVDTGKGADISQSIIQIAQDILNGNIDIQKAKMTIKQEAETRAKSHTGRIKMSQKQEKNYITNKISQVIISKSEQVPVQNPEKAVMQLQELYEGNIVIATETIVKSLIKTGQFETAEEICSKFTKISKEGEQIQIRNLRKLIKNARISKFINDLLKNKIPKNQEQKYFERIQKAIETEEIIPSQIILGKTQDGLKNITLENIWEEQRSK